ncbi:YbaK/EbsC family protein [Streptomyces griseoluteus]|uniref:YbaK/EbsC family protein n=1 Tax=Streptomyces griseoluteus TaxID=29306 RepID=UPI0036BA4A6D
MHERVLRVSGTLRELGSDAEVVELPDPAPTAATAAAQVGSPVGAIANSLVFSVGGDPLLVLVSGTHRVDTRRLTGLLGVAPKRIRRADPAFVLTATGQEVGGVAPVRRPRPARTHPDRRDPGRARARRGRRRNAGHGVPDDAPGAGTDHRW